MATLSTSSVQSNASGFNDVIQFQNSSGTQNAVAIRAYVRFDSSGVAPTRTTFFNVDTIADRGIGLFTVNFTNALTDANYAISGCSDRATDNRACSLVLQDGQTNNNGEAFIVYRDEGGSARDGDYCSCIVIR